MKKILESWWIYLCTGIVIFMFAMFIMFDLDVKLNLAFEGKEYTKKVGKNINPMIENIKIHVDGNEYEVVIIHGEFKNRHLDNEIFNLKTRMFEGRAVLNYYILKEGSEPFDEDYIKWCFHSIIPVKRESLLREYHINGEAINKSSNYYSRVYCTFITNFIDDFIDDRTKERYTGWSKPLKIEDAKYENNVVFTEDGEVDAKGELLLSYIAIDKEEKIKVTAKLVIESIKKEINLYIDTERM